MGSTDYQNLEKSFLDRLRIVTLLQDGVKPRKLKKKYPDLTAWVDEVEGLTPEEANARVAEEMKQAMKDRPADWPDYDDE